MEVLKFKQIIFTISILFLNSCIGELDFTGFVRSTDRIEDRYKLSMLWNESNPFKVITVTDENYKLLVSSDLHIGKHKKCRKIFRKRIRI